MKLEPCFWRVGKQALLRENQKGHSLESHQREHWLAIYRWLNVSGQRWQQMGPRQDRAGEGFLTRQPPICTAIRSPRAEWVECPQRRSWRWEGNSFSKYMVEHVGGEPKHLTPLWCYFQDFYSRPFLWCSRMLGSREMNRVTIGHLAVKGNIWDQIWCLTGVSCL